MYRKFRNVPILKDIPPICPYFLGFRVGQVCNYDNNDNADDVEYHDYYDCYLYILHLITCINYFVIIINIIISHLNDLHHNVFSMQKPWTAS